MLFKKKKKEISEGGSEIYRYEELNENQGLRFPAHQCVFAEEIEAYFDEMFPDSETTVLHEIISDLIHIDIHVMKPTENRNNYVIFTTGMSALPMTLPKKIKKPKELKYAELFMYLPEDWNPGDTYSSTIDMPEKDFWAISMIKFLARFPHDYKTWLGEGHTIPNGPDYSPILEDSEMGGVVLVEIFDNLKTKDGSKINFYSVAPVSKAETEYKLKYGMDALLEKFSEYDVPLVIDIYRKSII